MSYALPDGDAIDIQLDSYVLFDGDAVIINLSEEEENTMGNTANVIDRPFESMVISGLNGGAALPVQAITGNLKITSTEDAPTLANKMQFQRGTKVDVAIKLSEIVAGSGNMRRMGLSKVEVGEAGAAGIEPVAYTDLGFPNTGKASLTSVPYFVTTPDSVQLVRGKDTTLTIDLLETDDGSRATLEGFLRKILWVKLTTALGEVIKLKNVRMVFGATYGFSSDDTDVHTVKFVKRTKKITDALVVPADMTLLALLENGENVAGRMFSVVDVYGNTHEVGVLAYALGISFDLSDNGNPTFDITSTKYVAKLSDMYQIVPA